MEHKRGFYEKLIKRPLDFVLSLIALIVLCPILLAIAVLVRIKLGSPVIFKQKRPGLNEKIFTLRKFRTMTDAKSDKGELLPDSVRLTDFGKFLRATSLDELPELWNILKGDMSIIGPRPLLVQYLPLYNEHQKRRHEVRPGLSGLAQVKGRNSIGWEEKFKFDIDYVDNISFSGDIKIIMLTVKKVLIKEGINSSDAATMEPFRGTGKLKNKLLIIGASGHGKVVADIAINMNKWEKIAFLDDNEALKTSMGLEVIGKSADVGIYTDEFDIFVAIGNNYIRQKIIENIETAGADIPVLIHPMAVIGTDVKLGSGTAVMADAVINSSSRIGKGCIINTGSTVDHDNLIDDYVHISPGVNLAGNVKVGKSSWLGIGSVVINNINITGNCIIGAGAVVVRDALEPGTYIGIPARKI